MTKHKILAVRHITDSTFVVRFEREGIAFRAGQYLFLGREGTLEQKEYSIYSSEEDPYLEVLVRAVDEGLVSKDLQSCRPGDLLESDGPFGSFLLDDLARQTSNYVFVATGTGISPFHSFVRTYSDLNYVVLHGVRFGTEAYDRERYGTDSYVLCTSRDGEGDFRGRVTEFLTRAAYPDNSLFYLAGNSAMIRDAYDLLEGKGIANSRIHTEVYY